MRNKNGEISVMREENKMAKIIPPNIRKPGLGQWSFSENGYSHFLEISINHFKMAAARYGEKGLDFECEVFSNRALELEEELRLLQEQLAENASKNKSAEDTKKRRRKQTA